MAKSKIYQYLLRRYKLYEMIDFYLLMGIVFNICSLIDSFSVSWKIIIPHNHAIIICYFKIFLILTADANFVLTIPGATQLTLMLLDAKSAATIFVNPRSAVLLTEYAPNSYILDR